MFLLIAQPYFPPLLNRDFEIFLEYFFLQKMNRLVICDLQLSLYTWLL